MKTINKKDTLLVEGMTCSNCAAGIQKHLKSNGLEDITVNFSTSEANFVSDKISENEVKKMIESLGYSIRKESEKEKMSLQEKLFYFSLFFTLPLFSHMFLNEGHFLQNPFIQFLLCLPVYLVGTWFFGKSAISSIKSKSLNMDVLITMGSSAAFFYSVYGWYFNLGSNFLFFETSSTIITLVLLGNLLEHKSVQQTTTSIRDLSDIQKTRAKVERDNKIIEIDFDDILVGDILIVNSGDKIAVDGIVLEGNATVDESMITGESIPITKTINNNVIGGTVLQSGNIKARATNVGSDTLLSNIIELVKDAQNHKPQIQKLGDKISSIFVPIVLGISLITFLISFYIFPNTTSDLSPNNLIDSILRAVAVLVISCPCAMGLATPTAVMVGIGRAAKNGILIKGGNTLEKFAKIKHIFFDKTGTITTGNFKIKNLNVINEDESEIKNIIFNLETYSSHPIAKSLVSELKSFSDKLEFTNIHEEKGISIEGDYNGITYKIGSYKILEKDNDNHDLFIFKNNILIATIDIEDEIKQNTNEVISDLNSFGINTSLLSGDKKEKCKYLSDKISFNSVYSEQLPHEKLEIIKQRSLSETTAMVGDGVNDAPSLSIASVGISVGGSTGVAIQSSDVVLLNKNNLKQLTTALKISKHTFLTIKQNLFWAFAYNIVAIPIAAMGYLNPMWGALFMAFSDVIVIGNSIRLKYKKLD
ncbi:MAG: cadmium-translocating P-type ATPase [Flavobacteriales bacterium]|nr:cadmium-translocating P-type ATPase [Flavobacteriales bacterium]